MDELWKSDVRQMRLFDMNWRDIATACMHYFPNETYSQVYERVRHIDKSHHKKVQPTLKSSTTLRELFDGYIPTPVIFERKKETYGTNTLVFSDTHMPFNHPNYLQFLIDTYREKKCGHVVCLGDLVDHHALSRHDSEPCAKGAYDELDMALQEIRKYVEAFPSVKMCQGNHDAIVLRQSKTLGIGERFLKTFSELYCIPDTWNIAEEHIIDGVLYTHGINCGGKDGAINKATKECMSTVIGHSHAYAGCKYLANPRKIIFGMNTGCGIQISEYAFAYGMHSVDRPIIGCGVVYNDSHAEFIPMPSTYFRSA